MSIKDLKISALDASKGLTIGEYNNITAKVQAYGQCGAGLNCAGGGGQCGAGLNCAGGGGRCGAGLNCAGQ